MIVQHILIHTSWCWGSSGLHLIRISEPRHCSDCKPEWC